MKKSRILIAAMVLLFILSACAKAAMPEMAATEAPAYPGEARSYDNSMTTGASSDAYEEAAPQSPSAENASSASGEPIKQMVIMNANLSIAVDDPALVMTNIGVLAEGMGGFVVSSYTYKTQTYDGQEVVEANTTVRVPADKLNEALDKIKEMTGDVKKYTLSENVSGQDVTQEYTDLGSRLKNLEEADKKLTELYETAEKTEDALAIYTQKMQITEQIEVIKGQMNYYEQSAAKSAITVSIVDKKTIAPPITVAGWQPEGVAKDAIQALVNFGKGLVNFLIWLVITVIPIMAVIGLPIFFFVRWLVKRGRRKEAERQEALLKAMAAQQPPAQKK